MKHATTTPFSGGGRPGRWLWLLVALLSCLFANAALAARINGGLAGGVLVPPATAPSPVPTQFDLTGYMEAATLDTGFTLCPNLPAKDPRLAGGTATLNGHLIIIPCNTILQMPAFATSWADFISAAPPDISPPGTSGLSLSDPFVAGTAGLLDMTFSDPSRTVTSYNAPLPATELHVVGNVVNGQYVAGLVFVSQQSLNGGQGVISCIDYATGELQVGGVLQPVGAPCPALVPGVSRVRMNDPVGRFGIKHGLPGDAAADVWEPGYDKRFTADTDNPTMHSALGYPICIPSVNPVNPIINPITGATITPGIDPACPLYNRPIAPNCKSFPAATTLPEFGGQPVGTYCTTWVMDLPGARATDGVSTDPNVSAPLVIGDLINFSGTLKADARGPYISAHTIGANLGIYTQPHTQPSYVSMESLIVGTGGGTVGGIAVESTLRLAWVGFASDPTELVDFYAVHQDPLTGAESDFFLGTFDPCCAPLGRFRSPVNNLGVFGDPTRNYRAVSRTMCQPPGINAPNTPQLQTRCMMAPSAAGDPTAVAANIVQNKNGLTVGKYLLPNFEFIFGENLTLGGPPIPANLQDLPFLFCGSGPLDGPGTLSPVVGQLDPAPWALPMADPTFHNTLCPQVTAVSGAPGTPIVAPTQPVPPVINALTLVGNVIADGLPHVVTLTVTASNPNTPATTMSYAWKTTAPGVTLSCGACTAAPGVSPVSITATITTTSTASIIVTSTVSNGILPSATANLTIPVAPSGARAPTVTRTGAVQTGPTVTLTATAKANNGTTPVVISFRQTGGPAVGQVLTATTGLPPNQTASAAFTVPVSATSDTFTFVAVATDTANGLQATSGTITVKSPAILVDQVTVTNVTYRPIVSRVGAPADLGKLNITASSNETDVNTLPAGMTMTATFSNNTLPANVPGSTALPMTMPLKYTPPDVPGTPAAAAVCGPTACWVGNVNGVIQDTSKTPGVLVAPTIVTIRSSLGGTASVTQASPVFTIR